MTSKVEEVRQQLYALALEKGPGAQLPTVRELCTTLNTTNTTLRDALDLLESENILYREARKGVFVSTTINHQNFLVVMDISLLTGITVSPFWNMLWHYLMQEVQQREVLHKQNYTFCLQNDPPLDENRLPEEVVKTIHSSRVQGCIVIGFNTKGDTWEISLPAPHVVFAGYGPYTVLMDGDAIGFHATQMLLRQGCKRIGLWTGHANYLTNPDFHVQNLQEYYGMRRALEASQVHFYPELLRYPINLPNKHKIVTYQEQGYLLAKEVFTPPETLKPDGIFIANDMITDGAIVALEELGIRVGQDIQVATHANTGSPTLFGRTKHMTVLEFDPREVVHSLFSLLDMLVLNQTPPANVIRLQPKLRDPEI